MKKEIKRRGIVCVVAAAGYAAALVGTEYWQLQGNARMLVFLIPYLLMVWETGRLLWKSLKKRKLFDENLLILLATVGAFFVHRYSEAVGAMLFFQIGKLVETFSMLRTRKSIEKFMDIRPQYANLKISGGEIQVPPEELNPRQIIIIKPGERIPVDAVVTQGSSTLDTKALTGEAEPRHVQIGSRIYSGSINISGVLEARVLKASADSTASRIIDMISNADNRRAGTENFAEKFTRYYTPLVTLFGILVMILPPMMLDGPAGGIPEANPKRADPVCERISWIWSGGSGRRETAGNRKFKIYESAGIFLSESFGDRNCRSCGCGWRICRIYPDYRCDQKRSRMAFEMAEASSAGGGDRDRR